MTDEPDAETEMMAAQKDLAAGDLLAVENGIMIRVHEASACVGRAEACWVHRPSTWPLATAPVVWDNVSGRAYRRCGHGVLHRDLDDYNWEGRHSTRFAGMPPWCCAEASDCACCRKWEDSDE